MNWTSQDEEKLLYLKDEKKLTYKLIAAELDTTVSSVKHKYIRLKQAANADEHHHPIEKTEQVKRVLGSATFNSTPFILEAHAGWGNLTQVYSEYGVVQALEIDEKKVDHIIANGTGRIFARKCDSMREFHNTLYRGHKYEVIDLDPYGFPSRYFPHVFELITDGYLFVTFPKMGVQQINKITKEHYRIFWGMTLDDKEFQEHFIHKKMKDYGLMSFRRVDLIDTVELPRMFRFAYRVRKESALDLVDLKVKGVNC